MQCMSKRIEASRSIAISQLRRDLLTKPVVSELADRDSLGIFQGYIHNVVDPFTTPRLRRESIARSDCEVVFLITGRPDGKFAVTLTHFIPNYPQNQLAVISAMTPSNLSERQVATRHGEGIRRAVFLTTNPISLDEDHREQDPQFGPIYKALKTFNLGQEPDIICVTDDYMSRQPDDDQFVYEMHRKEDGTVYHSFSVTGTSYMRSGTLQEIAAQNAKTYDFR